MALFRCTNCLLEKEVSDSFLGKKVKCPRCEHKFIFVTQAHKNVDTLGTLIDRQNEPTQTESEARERYLGPKSTPVVIDTSPGAKDPKDWNKPTPKRQPPTTTLEKARPDDYFEHPPLEEFLNTTVEREHGFGQGQGRFEVENECILKLSLDNNGVWIRTGSMIAHRGNIRFRREGMLEFGISRLLKRAFTGEGATLTRAEGSGQLYLASRAKKVSVFSIGHQGMVVNAQNLLAFEDSVEFNLTLMKSVGSWMAGGLFNFQLKGHGRIALATYQKPLTLQVTEAGISTDPNATVAWADRLTPSLKTDFRMGTQMKFKGNGFVMIQPTEGSNLGSASKGPQIRSRGNPALIVPALALFFTLMVLLPWISSFLKK